MPPRRRNTHDNAQGGSSAPVTGPRSALTSFLREQGITGNNARLNYSNRRPAPTPSTAATTASTTAANSDDDDNDNSTSVSLTADPAASSSSSVTASAAPSTDANAEAGPSTASSTKKRKGKDSTATAAAAAAKKKKKNKADVDGDDFTLAGVPHTAPKKGRYENRLPGSIAVCAECGKKFTVSKYTASNPHGAGVLCAPCTTESIEDRASFPSASKAAAKKPPKKKAQRAELETLYTPVPTLQQTCLAVVGQYATDIDALGDIGLKNLDRVAKVLCKNRALTGDNLKLFLEVGHRELRLYDCTLVKDQDLAQISTFCPHLERLALNLCGRLDDDVIDAWSKGFKELRHLSLYAPYLVTGNKWVEFLEQCGTDRPELETFELRMSSRFDDAALAALIAHNPSLVTLQLAELGRLTSASLAALHPLAQHGTLTSLDLARLGTPQGHVLDDDDVVALLAHVGAGLVSLTLDGNERLTEKVLIDGVKRHCPSLRKLSLGDCVEMHTEGVEALFGATPMPAQAPVEDAGGEAAEEAPGAATGAMATEGEGEDAGEADKAAENGKVAAAIVDNTPWSSPGLHTLNLHRLGSLSPLALRALLAHSGRTLRHLSLHSCDELDAPLLTDALARGGAAPDLEVLDLSFVRATDNFVVQALLEGCERLRILFLHGNNRVTADVPRKAGVQLRGLENALHSEIPPDMPW
ncbi:hypothetical protein JCM9279_006978 [Rhodotorula babjevae]